MFRYNGCDVGVMMLHAEAGNSCLIGYLLRQAGGEKIGMQIMCYSLRLHA